MRAERDRHVAQEVDRRKTERRAVDARIERHERTHIDAALMQKAGERARYIGEPAGLCKWREFGCDERNAHRKSISTAAWALNTKSVRRKKDSVFRLVSPRSASYYSRRPGAATSTTTTQSMLILIISPGYPAEMPHFTRGLAEVGATVLGVGDSPRSRCPRPRARRSRATCRSVRCGTCRRSCTSCAPGCRDASSIASSACGKPACCSPRSCARRSACRA